VLAAGELPLSDGNRPPGMSAHQLAVSAAGAPSQPAATHASIHCA
jgi:hypothetical protein